MMLCAALFIGIGYYAVNGTNPPPPPPPKVDIIGPIENHIDQLSKQLYSEDSCKIISANIEDAALDNTKKQNLKEQLDRAILLSLIKTYNHYKSIDCGNLQNRKVYFSKLLVQFKQYTGEKTEVNRCKADYANISAFKNLQNKILALKKKQYDEVAISAIKSEINTLHARIGGCLSQEKDSYNDQLLDFFGKHRKYEDLKKNPKLVVYIDPCATFAGYSYYLAQFKCQ